MRSKGKDIFQFSAVSLSNIEGKLWDDNRIRIYDPEFKLVAISKDNIKIIDVVEVEYVKEWKLDHFTRVSTKSIDVDAALITTKDGSQYITELPYAEVMDILNPPIIEVKVRDYQILTTSTYEALVNNVKKYIDEGWLPQGGIAVINKSENSQYDFLQAMIKEASCPIQ